MPFNAIEKNCELSIINYQLFFVILPSTPISDFSRAPTYPIYPISHRPRQQQKKEHLAALFYYASGIW